jgi:hypothetical protein
MCVVELFARQESVMDSLKMDSNLLIDGQSSEGKGGERGGHQWI